MIFEVKCKNCGSIFYVECSEKDFNKGKYRKTCSSKCAHFRIQSDETKKKISKSLTKEKYKKCELCGNTFLSINKSKYCSDNCKHISKHIDTLINYFGFDRSFIGTLYIFDEYERIKNMLINDYWNNNMTGIELGKKYNYPSPCNITGKLFKYMNIPTRSCRDTTKLNILNGKINLPGNHTKYIHGWHNTWDNKDVYLRSSYEYDYAKFLDENHIKYEVEYLRIKYWNSQTNEFRCAIPDFYLPESNTIVEIKSTYTLNKTEMIDKFKEYKKLGYNCKLILDKKEVYL